MPEPRETVAQSVRLTAEMLLKDPAVRGLLDDVIGGWIVNPAGIVADHLRYLRFKNFLKLVEKAQKLNAERGGPGFRKMPPKFALPFLEHATLEEEEEVRELYARCLVRYHTDPSEPCTLPLAAILRDFTPKDAFIFKAVVLRACSHENSWWHGFSIRDQVFHQYLPGEPWEPAVTGTDGRRGDWMPRPQSEWKHWDNLARLGLIKSPLPHYAGSGLTHLGAALGYAIFPEVWARQAFDANGQRL